MFVFPAGLGAFGEAIAHAGEFVAEGLFIHGDRASQAFEGFDVGDGEVGSVLLVGQGVGHGIARAEPDGVVRIGGREHEEPELGEVRGVEKLLEQALESAVHRLAVGLGLGDLFTDFRGDGHQRADVSALVRGTVLAGAVEGHSEAGEAEVA